jgi:hypothetical protein
MLESPVLRSSLVIYVSETNAIVFYLAEPVEIELAHEGREIVVLKILRNDLRGKSFGVFDKECGAIRGPGKNKRKCQHRTISIDTPALIIPPSPRLDCSND